MATVTGHSRCMTCGKEKATSRCVGCLQDFCYSHLGEHRQQLDSIEVYCDLLHEKIAYQTTEPLKYMLIQEINQWEQGSIVKIRQTADEARQLLSKYTNKYFRQTEEKLNEITKQLKQCRMEDDIIETDLLKWKEELQQMTEQLSNLSETTIQHTSTPLINQLSVPWS